MMDWFRVRLAKLPKATRSRTVPVPRDEGMSAAYKNEKPSHNYSDLVEAPESGGDGLR